MPETSPAPRRKRAYTMSPDELSARGTHAINARWAKTADRQAATAPGRAAARARYYRIPDELGITDPELRDKLAKNAEQAEMARLRLIQIRQAKADRQAAATNNVSSGNAVSRADDVQDGAA